MKDKKDKFFKLIKDSRSAVLVGPLLKKTEAQSINSPHLLLVDGGLDLATEYSLDANRSCFSVGDGDSSKGPLDEILPIIKDYSDLAYALSILPEEVETVELYGFLGGRLDHELCNFGEVFHYLKDKKNQTKVIIGPEVMALSSGTWKLSKQGSFSLISFEDAEVKLTGDAVFELGQWTKIKAFSSHGLSNEGSGIIELHLRSPILLYGAGFIFKDE
ncbi:MAG: thiamine pyrophosphokinase [Bacteriovoracaceae bacterium]|jgi:thiamine pyrophosphokinase